MEERYLGTQVTRISVGVLIAKSQGIQKRCVSSYVGNCSPSIGMVGTKTRINQNKEKPNHKNSNSLEFMGLKGEEIKDFGVINSSAIGYLTYNSHHFLSSS